MFFSNLKIPFCERLGYNCDFKTNALDPEGTTHHFQQIHNVVVVNATSVKIGMRNVRAGLEQNADVDGTWQSVILQNDNQPVLITTIYKSKNDYVSIMAFDLAFNMETKASDPGFSHKGKLLIQQEEHVDQSMDCVIAIHSTMDLQRYIASPLKSVSILHYWRSIKKRMEFVTLTLIWEVLMM